MPVSSASGLRPGPERVVEILGALAPRRQGRVAREVGAAGDHLVERHVLIELARCPPVSCGLSTISNTALAGGQLFDVPSRRAPRPPRSTRRPSRRPRRRRSRARGPRRGAAAPCAAAAGPAGQVAMHRGCSVHGDSAARRACGAHRPGQRQRTMQRRVARTQRVSAAAARTRSAAARLRSATPATAVRDCRHSRPLRLTSRYWLTSATASFCGGTSRHTTLLCCSRRKAASRRCR